MIGCMIRVMWTPEAYLRALHFASERHAGQLVPGTSHPYLVHLVSVAAEVMRGAALEPLDRPDLAVTCALLHDVVEDTPTPVADVAAAFGDDVARGVSALSKDPALPKDQQLADSLARIRACPREVWAVKLADRITNLQPPPARWDGAKRRRYQHEAREIHAALGAGHGVLGARLAHMIEAYTAHLDPA
jgi:(p)ppGpp synthase/HD superfamily hydrolase